MNIVLHVRNNWQWSRSPDIQVYFKYQIVPASSDRRQKVTLMDSWMSSIALGLSRCIYSRVVQDDAGGRRRRRRRGDAGWRMEGCLLRQLGRVRGEVNRWQTASLRATRRVWSDVWDVWSSECSARRVTPASARSITPNHRATNLKYQSIPRFGRSGPGLLRPWRTNMSCNWLLATPIALTPEVLPTTSANSSGQAPSGDWMNN